MADAVDSPGALRGTGGPEGGDPDRVLIDNRSGLPDADVRDAIMAQWVETAAMQFGTPSSFQLYATSGQNMLTRSPFRTPSNVIEEIKLARQVAETDDDIASVIGQAVNTAFKDGMQNLHEDEATLGLFNEVAKNANLDIQLKELYREYLITGSVTTLQLFSRQRLSFTPSGTEERVQAQLSVPRIGILPAENLRVMSNDIFGEGSLAYDVTDQALKDWLDAYFDRASPARRAQMAREQPIMAALFTGKVTVPFNDQDMFSAGKTLYTLNPRMVHRTTMPKGANAYARPPMTSNFALLEAKRLLNIMDYALLQGGTNYIVVAKQGSDKLPAQQPEIDNLTDQVRAASRTGVLVGDHRLEIEIITPNLSELLEPKKRKLIGRKLAMAILRIPEQVTEDPGSEGAKQELEFTANTVTADRRDIKRHVERFTYEQVVSRNPTTFKKGAPSLWFPKIILSGVKDFYDSVVKARDRGDIPRAWAVEVLGFDYDSGVAQRKREKERGDDEVMTPGAVPFDSPQNQQPGDGGGEGRPVGSSSSNGRPGGASNVDPAQRQRSLIRRRRGESIRASWDQERGEILRVGELTAAVVEEYPDHTVGRVSQIERDAVDSGDIYQEGPVAVVPVNPGYEVTEVRALRLAEGLAMIVGQRKDDGAVVAKALCFREPQFDVQKAEELACRWGFVTRAVEVAEVAELLPAEPPPQPGLMEFVAQVVQGMTPETVAAIGTVFQGFSQKQPIIVNIPGEGAVEFIRDEETGAIIGKRPVSVEEE